jgi:hypothetical protein
MTRTTDAILADILVHPELDALRLEFADACEAKDPDRATYIRREVAHELAWAHGNPHSRRGDGDVARRLFQPLARFCIDILDDWTASRGFIEEVTIDPYVFIEHGGALCDLAPIQHVTFMPTPLPHDVPVPFPGIVLPSVIPELMRCPHLRRIRGFSFTESTAGCWFLTHDDIDHILDSPHLDDLLVLTTPVARAALLHDADYQRALWPRVFARPNFRRMLVTNFRFHAGWPGDGIRAYDDDLDTVREFTPVPPEGRDLERRFGYIPALHNHNRITGNRPFTYGELVLNHRRGILPRFPPGAPITEEMYGLPAPIRRQNLFP